MLLSFNIAGLPFIGSDAGGFFGNPDAELMTRWFQAAAYHPFFRGHAHHDAKRREPYVFGEPHTSRLRAATIARYALLPLWYTLFHESHVTGAPVMRALWMHYPDDEKVFGMDDQFLVGSDLLVKPVTEQGAVSTQVYLPGGSSAVWYDVDTYAKLNGGQTISVDTPIEKIPVYQRGGSIVPRQLRVRRSSKLMQHDPYTLFIALDANGKAEGTLYLDDFHTFDYQKGVYALRRFQFVDNKLSATNAAEKDQTFSPSNKIERIVIFGLNLASTDKIIVNGRKLEATFNAQQKVYTIRKPMLGVADDWVINF